MNPERNCILLQDDWRYNKSAPPHLFNGLQLVSVKTQLFQKRIYWFSIAVFGLNGCGSLVLLCHQLSMIHPFNEQEATLGLVQGTCGRLRQQCAS
jgi:hypothetical protein